MFKLIIVTILLNPHGEWETFRREAPFKHKEQCHLAAETLKAKGFPPFVYVCAPVTQQL